MKIESREIKLIPIDEIRPREDNPNRHPEEQLQRLEKIIKYQGFRSPLIVSNQSGFLVSGHGRLDVAKRLGFKELPVIFQDFENEDAEYAHVVAENSIASWSELDLSLINLEIPNLGPDFDIEMLGLKDFKIDPVEKLEPGSDEDHVPEHVDPKTILGDIYQLGNHRLMCGDSTSIDAVEKLMAGEKADMVFTDPPYGIEAVNGDGPVGSVGIANAAPAGKYRKIEGDDSIDAAVDSFNLCTSLLPESIKIFFGANYYCHALPPGFGWLVWDKQREGNTFSGAELAFVSKGARVDVFRHQWHGMIKGSERGEKRVHPTQKPIALAEWCFENYGQPKSVLDLFGGSGSTLIACEKTNRNCFMMELDPKYCDVILARWEKYTGKKAELLPA